MKQTLIILLFCILAIRLAAQPAGFVRLAGEQAFEKGYREMCRHTTSFRAHFEQVKKVALLKNALRSQGRMYMRNDNKIKIAYTQPYQYVFVMNNGVVTIKDGTSAATSMNMRNNKLFKQISAITLAGINGTLLGTDAFVTTVFESPDRYLVQAVPQTKEMKAYYKMFELYFDKTTFHTAKIVLSEVSGDVSTITFHTIETNQPIDHAVFEVR